jgi:hypothetical protein
MHREWGVGILADMKDFGHKKQRVRPENNVIFF